MNGQDRPLVTGLGPVGLAAAMLGRALGAHEVIGVDTNPGRLEQAPEAYRVMDGGQCGKVVIEFPE